MKTKTTTSMSQKTDSEACPEWCTSTDHLSMKFQTRKGDYFHLSETVEFPSTDLDHNWHPVFFRLELAQRMEGDGKFNYVTHPAEVVLGGTGLTPDDARGLAALLVELAGRAEATPAAEPT